MELLQFVLLRNSPPDGKATTHESRSGLFQVLNVRNTRNQQKVEKSLILTFLAGSGALGVLSVVVLRRSFSARTVAAVTQCTIWTSTWKRSAPRLSSATSFQPSFSHREPNIAHKLARRVTAPACVTHLYAENRACSQNFTTRA